METRKFIKNTFQNKEYSNCNNITFIQSSDFHGAVGSRPGAQNTCFEFDKKIDFWALRKLLKDGSPILSSEEIDTDYQEYIKNKRLIEIDLKNEIAIKSEELKNSICKNFCAYLNTENSIFQINLYNTNQNYSEAVDETIELLKNNVYNNLDPMTTVPFRVLDFSVSSSKKRLIINTLSRKKLYQFKGDVYFKDQESVKIAGSSEIESIVTRNSYNLFYKRKERFLAKRIQDISLVSKSFYSQSLKYKIREKIKGLDFGKKVDDPIFPNINQDLLKLKADQANGVTDGNCYIIENDSIKGGRLNKQQSYLRITCPEYKCIKDVDQFENNKTLEEDSIIITVNGAVYKIDKQMTIFTDVPLIEFSLTNDDKFDFDILLGLSAYLKSNFLLWYILMFYETDDIFGLFLRESPLIPIPSDIQILKNISIKAANIRKEEIKFIKSYNKMDKTERNSKHDKLINKHNISCTNQLQLIEKEIMNYYGLFIDDIRLIISDLDSLDYHTYKLNVELDNIFGQ